MDKAQPFDFYFNDEQLSPEKLARMQLTRQLAHELYPEVEEKVSYAMPGFYPKGAKKANQQLFIVMVNKKWLGLYGILGLEEDSLKVFQSLGVESGKGSLRVPYELAEDSFRDLLRLVIQHNLKRQGLN